MLGTIISLGTAVFGASQSRKASKQASAAAQAQAQQAADAEAAALDFAKEQYADWKAVFGDVAQNLSNYYSRLGNSDYATVRGLEAFEMEKDRALGQLRQTLDQRGLGTSGAAAQIEQDFAELTAVERAQIRANAPREAAQEQLGFLALGLQSDPSGRTLGVMDNRATRMGGRAMLTSQLAASAAQDRVGAYTGAIESVGTTLETILNRDK